MHFAAFWSAMKKYQLAKFGDVRKAKFWDTCWVWKWHRSLDFFVLLYLLSSSSTFLASFFSFTGHLVGFISVGKVFLGKLLRLDEGKVHVGGYWNKIVHDFWVNVTIMNFWFFLWSPWLNHALFWYGLKDLFILHRLVDNVVLNYSNWWHHNW